MGSRAPVMRLFVGLYPPAEAAASMLSLLGPLALPGHRATPLAQLHMTVQFIGDRAERELAEVIESVERSASGIAAFALAPRMLITLPERGDARLVALETTAPAELLELQRRLALRLAEPRRNRGRFTPHLTLCRFARAARMPRLNEAVELAPTAIDEVRLMKSVLRPGGAEHALVHRVSLGP